MNIPTVFRGWTSEHWWGVGRLVLALVLLRVFFKVQKMWIKRNKRPW